jgi:hypothetical protein
VDVAAEELDHLGAGFGAQILDHAHQDLLLSFCFDENSLFDANRPVGLLLVRRGLHVGRVWYLPPAPYARQLYRTCAALLEPMPGAQMMPAPLPP